MNTNGKNVKVLYAYISDEQNEWLEEIKKGYGISKTDVTVLLISYARKFFTLEQINSMFDTFLFEGEKGLQRVA